MSIAKHYDNESAQKAIKERIEKYALQVEKMVHFVKDMPVSSEWGAEEALEYAGEAKRLYKCIESTRKEITDPARKFVAYVNNTAKRFTDKLEEVEGIVKFKLGVWRQKQEENLLAEEKATKELLESLELDVAPYCVSSPKLHAESATAYEKTEWKFDVTDISQIPLEFLKVDEDKIKLAVKMGVREIPGIKIFSQKQTVIRSR